MITIIMDKENENHDTETEVLTISDKRNVYAVTYPLSRFKSNLCPAVTLSISYLHSHEDHYKAKKITYGSYWI